ncbi:hypothetical protein M9H77_23601 [Catharanthus roseus]|uniref:Uncharacterized protein n=1 Tax=Catharanthus roseus TaxID=4058 RepID=A0ACC0AWL0_CATRO|nr:hypothetical protein M9H77_23601 [Catharanthus roseus]
MGTNLRIDSPWEQAEPRRRAYLQGQTDALLAKGLILITKIIYLFGYRPRAYSLRFLYGWGRPLKTTIPSVKLGKKLSLILILYRSTQDKLSNLGESYSNSLNPSLNVGEFYRKEFPSLIPRERPMPLLELSSYYTSPPMH